MCNPLCFIGFFLGMIKSSVCDIYTIRMVKKSVKECIYFNFQVCLTNSTKELKIYSFN